MIYQHQAKPLQEAFFFAAIHGKDSVICDFCNRLAIIAVSLINTQIILCAFGNDISVRTANIAKLFSARGIIGNHFRNNILCAGNRRIAVRHFIVYKIRGVFKRVKTGLLLINFKRKRLKPLGLGNGCPCFALWPELAVSVLNLRERLGV